MKQRTLAAALVPVLAALTPAVHAVAPTTALSASPTAASPHTLASCDGPPETVLARTQGFDARALLGLHQARMDDVVLGADLGRDLERGLQHLHVARQPPGFVHEIDRQRPVHGIADRTAGAGGDEPLELRLPDAAAHDDVHVVGRQLDELDPERLDHVELGAEV